VTDRVKPSLVIFNIRTLWRSGLSVRVPGCQKLKCRLNPVWHRMLYSCNLVAPVGIKGLNTTRHMYNTLIIFICRNADKPTSPTFVHEQEPRAAVRRPLVIGQRRWRHGVNSDAGIYGRIEQPLALVVATQTERVCSPTSVVVVVVCVVFFVAVDDYNLAAVVFRRSVAHGG